jgi:hypothetical protein
MRLLALILTCLNLLGCAHNEPRVLEASDQVAPPELGWLRLCAERPTYPGCTPKKEGEAK